MKLFEFNFNEGIENVLETKTKIINLSFWLLFGIYFSSRAVHIFLTPHFF